MRERKITEGSLSTFQLYCNIVEQVRLNVEVVVLLVVVVVVMVVVVMMSSH